MGKREKAEKRRHRGGHHRSGVKLEKLEKRAKPAFEGGSELEPRSSNGQYPLLIGKGKNLPIKKMEKKGGFFGWGEKNERKNLTWTRILKRKRDKRVSGGASFPRPCEKGKERA